MISFAFSFSLFCSSDRVHLPALEPPPAQARVMEEGSGPSPRNRRARTEQTENRRNAPHSFDTPIGLQRLPSYREGDSYPHSLEHRASTVELWRRWDELAEPANRADREAQERLEKVRERAERRKAKEREEKERRKREKEQEESEERQTLQKITKTRPAFSDRRGRQTPKPIWIPESPGPSPTSPLPPTPSSTTSQAQSNSSHSRFGSISSYKQTPTVHQATAFPIQARHQRQPSGKSVLSPKEPSLHRTATINSTKSRHHLPPTFHDAQYPQ